MIQKYVIIGITAQTAFLKKKYLSQQRLRIRHEIGGVQGGPYGDYVMP